MKGGCKKFCVSGHFAGDCIFQEWIKNDYNKSLPNDLIDRLLSDYKSPEDLIGENGLLKQLTKALVERVLQAEITGHLGHDKHAPVTNETRNARNGKSNKALKGISAGFRLKSPVTATAASNRN
jgi:Transposase, Mutator family